MQDPCSDPCSTIPVPFVRVSNTCFRLFEPPCGRVCPTGLSNNPIFSSPLAKSCCLTKFLLNCICLLVTWTLSIGQRTLLIWSLLSLWFVHRGRLPLSSVAFTFFSTIFTPDFVSFGLIHVLQICSSVHRFPHHTSNGQINCLNAL